MKVLMLGWEFPPFFAGGLGMVCYELTKALSKKGIDITYVMATSIRNNPHKFLKVISPPKIGSLKNLKIKQINTTIQAYDSSSDYFNHFREFEKVLLREDNKESKNLNELYGWNIIQEVFLYANRVKNLAYFEDFDLIHSHDWTTLPAAILLKKITNKPFIAHVHITEYDKTGGYSGHPEIMKIEKWGWTLADKIIAVSNFTKNRQKRIIKLFYLREELHYKKVQSILLKQQKRF